MPMKLPPKTSKLYAAGLFLTVLELLLFVQAAFNLDPPFSPSEPNQIVLLFLLSTFIFLILLVFGFVLLRDVVKVWVERKQQKPGSKFKTSILVSLVSLTLIPAVFLFLFGFSLVNRSIVKWFSVPVDTIFSATRDMTAEWEHDQESLARALLTHLANEPQEDLGEVRRTFQLKAFMVLNENGRILRSSAEPDVQQYELAARIVPGLANRDEAFLNIPPYWIGVKRTADGQTNESLVAVFPRPERILALTDKIAGERENYSLLVQKRKTLRD